MKKICLFLLFLFLGASQSFASLNAGNSQNSSTQFLQYTFQTPQQCEEYKQLYRYNKWVEAQPNFVEFYSWYKSKLATYGLTLQQFNQYLYEYVMSGKSTFAQVQIMIENWYLDFHFSNTYLNKSSLDDTIAIILNYVSEYKYNLVKEKLELIKKRERDPLADVPGLALEQELSAIRNRIAYEEAALAANEEKSKHDINPIYVNFAIFFGSLFIGVLISLLFIKKFYKTTKPVLKTDYMDDEVIDAEFVENDG